MANRKFRTRTYGQHLRLVVKLSVGVGLVVAVLGSLANWLVIRTDDFFGFHLPHAGVGLPVECGAVVGLAAGCVVGVLLRPRDEHERGGDGGRKAQIGGRMWNGADADEPLGAGGSHRAKESLT